MNQLTVEDYVYPFTRVWTSVIFTSKFNFQGRSWQQPTFWWCFTNWDPKHYSWSVHWSCYINLKCPWSVLLTQYCAGDKIEKNEMGWACGTYGWGEGAYRVLVRKSEGKRPLGRPRRRWVDNIRVELQEVGCGYMDWIGLAQDRDRWRTLVTAVMNLRVPWNAGNFLTSCKPVSFSRRTLHHGVSK